MDTTQQQEAGRARWAQVPPDQVRAKVRPALLGTYRRGIDGAIGRIQDRAQYLSDEQRTRLRELADGR